MTNYEAQTSKNFSSHGRLYTAKQKVGQLINSEWIYSMHWSKKNDWINDAQESLEIETKYAKERLRELEQARSILNSIENQGE